MKYPTLLIPATLSIIFLVSTSSLAGPIDSTDYPHQEHVRAVHESEHEVDHAWEVYHQAALGGTVASPKLQAEIEEHLHQARALITQAHEAADQGDAGQVERLIKQVRIHTSHAIEGSKESKQ
ncbi:MAG: hypothetical protein JSR31_11775 [Nitrospira sp.]|nr:hypothetical protein [Nitrospira sp.]